MKPRRFRDFVDAWHWLYDHPKFRRIPRDRNSPAFDGFFDNLSVSVFKIDPKTKDIYADGAEPTRGALTSVSLEAGPYEDIRRWPKKQRDNFKAEIASGDFEMRSHDWALDSWGPTYEAAILMMARKVLKHYGDYTPCPDCYDLGIVTAENSMSMKACPRCRKPAKKRARK